MTRVIIAGSRSLDKEIGDLIWCLVVQQLETFNATEVVSGGAIGADHFGEVIAKEHKLPVKQFLPRYDTYPGKIAPLKRNEEMAIYADALIAIWDGKSRGTKNMIENMKLRNKPVEVIQI